METTTVLSMTGQSRLSEFRGLPELLFFHETAEQEYEDKTIPTI